MNLELFIARRLLKGKQNGAVSVPIVKIALAGIALGVCVMLLSILIITGFKNEITTKLSGFMAHLSITAYDHEDAYSGSEIELNDSLLEVVRRVSDLKQMYAYVTKPAILKSKEEIHGIILKGMDSSYDASFYRKHLREGEYPDFFQAEPSREVLISVAVADYILSRNKPMDDFETKVDLTVDAFVPPSYIKNEALKMDIYKRIAGIESQQEYDDMLAVCDIRHLQKLNNWAPREVSGIAVELNDMKRILEVEAELDDTLPMNQDDDFYKITTLRETAPQVFDWLNLLNMNVWIILTLIVVVAGFNMVSGLLILILDKTSFIGILKALGYRNIRLRRLFLYIAAGLIGKGMVVGNILALTLGGLQALFRIVRLDSATYYMDTVPIYFDWVYIILLNVGVLVVSVLMLVVPTMLISRIKPIKAIRFE